MRAASEKFSDVQGNIVYLQSPDYVPSWEKVRVESRAGITSLEGVLIIIMVRVGICTAHSIA